MDATPNTAYSVIAVKRLSEGAWSAANRVVACARTVHGLGATAESCRAGALELERQPDRAADLLFGQAVRTLRAAAAEIWLVADALDAIEDGR